MNLTSLKHRLIRHNDWEKMVLKSRGQDLSPLLCHFLTMTSGTSQSIFEPWFICQVIIRIYMLEFLGRLNKRMCKDISLLPASWILSINIYFLCTNWQRHLAPQGTPWLCSGHRSTEAVCKMEWTGKNGPCSRSPAMARPCTLPFVILGRHGSHPVSVVYRLLTSILQTRKLRLGWSHLPQAGHVANC